MNTDLSIFLKLFADENFQGDLSKAEEFLIEYGLKKLGYIKAPKIRHQRNINLGKLIGKRRDFLFEITDKLYRGKYATAIFDLLPIGLLYEETGTVDAEILIEAKIKKNYDLEAINRRATRKKDNPFIISYTADQDKLIEQFYEFITEKGIKQSEGFSYLIGTCLKLYEELDET